jgi:hypothetical protein
MQTLHLVNPRSGRTDIDKSTLRQNPYLVDECYADLDSNTDRSSLRQNLYLVDRCSGDIDSNSALHIGHAVNINTMSDLSNFARQSAVGAAKAAAGGFYSAVRGTASGISSLAKAAAETDTTRTHSASAAATDARNTHSASAAATDARNTHSASAAATDARKTRPVSRPPKAKQRSVSRPPKAKQRSVSRPPKEKTGPPKAKTGPPKAKQRSVSRPPKEKTGPPKAKPRSEPKAPKKAAVTKTPKKKK